MGGGYKVCDVHVCEPHTHTHAHNKDAHLLHMHAWARRTPTCKAHNVCVYVCDTGPQSTLPFPPLSRDWRPYVRMGYRCVGVGVGVCFGGDRGGEGGRARTHASCHRAYNTQRSQSMRHTPRTKCTVLLSLVRACQTLARQAYGL